MLVYRSVSKQKRPLYWLNAASPIVRWSASHQELDQRATEIIHNLSASRVFLFFPGVGFPSQRCFFSPMLFSENHHFQLEMHIHLWFSRGNLFDQQKSNKKMLHSKSEDFAPFGGNDGRVILEWLKHTCWLGQKEGMQPFKKGQG